jgi:hypothetical protein
MGFRWTEPDDPSAPVHWSGPALIVATAVLNVPFLERYGLNLWGLGPALLQLPLIAGASVLITCLFFIGPGLALLAAKRSLFVLVDDLIGHIPATLFRLCCVVALSCWVGSLLGTLMDMVRWIAGEQGSFFYVAVSVSLLAFLFLTAARSVTAAAKLAMFTNKLAIALLVAAAIRVRDGWPAIPSGFPDHGQSSWTWYGIAGLSFFVGPIAFFAAGLANRATSRKAVIAIGAFGLTMPVALSLAAVGLIAVATANSVFYRPSLNPTIGMALCSGVARSRLPVAVAIAAVTAFGALRFGIRALDDTAGRRVLYPILIAVIAWIAFQDGAKYAVVFDLSASVIAAMAAVLTANFVTGGRAAPPSVNLVALVAGAVLPVCFRSSDPNAVYSHPGFLHSYAVAFVVYLILKALNSLRMVR